MKKINIQYTDYLTKYYIIFVYLILIMVTFSVYWQIKDHDFVGYDDNVYIYENNGTILMVNGKPWPLTQDNSYRYHWDSGNVTWKPVLRVIVDNLDDGKFSVAYRYENLLEMSPLSYADEIDAWYKCNHVAIFNGEKQGVRREVLLIIR